MRVVQSHIDDKRRQRALAGLKRTLEQTKTKSSNNRMACKFRLFRYKHFLMLTAFKAIKQRTQLMLTKPQSPLKESF
jgi:hypothetical protein